MNLCTTNPAYDSDDCANIAFAITTAKRELGTAIQRRGMLANITFKNSDRLHPDYAGELAATALDLTQQQLSNWRVWDVAEWTNQFSDLVARSDLGLDAA